MRIEEQETHLTLQEHDGDYEIGLLKSGQDSPESPLALIHLIVRKEVRFRNQILSANFSGTYLISNAESSKGILNRNYLSYGN